MHSSTEYLASPRRVAEELQLVLLVYVGDREQVPEHPLEGDVLAGAMNVIRDEQRLERGRLDVEEVRHRHAALALAERDYRSGLRHQSLTLTQHKWPQRGSPAGGGVGYGARQIQETSESVEGAFVSLK